MITQNGESSRDLLLSVTNRKALAPGGQTPFKTLITLLPVTFSKLDPQLGVGWGKRLPFNRWLKLFNSQIFSPLTFGIKGCSSKTRFISSIFSLLCIVLWHYVREHIIYTVYSDWVLVFAFAFLSCKKKSALNRTFSTESYRNWRKSKFLLIREFQTRRPPPPPSRPSFDNRPMF